MAATLPDKVRKNFSRIKVKHISVKVPKLKARSKRASKPKKDEKLPMSSIISILIRKSLEEAKKEKKGYNKIETKSYQPSKEENQEAAGGYGTVSKNYGTSPISSYVDYGKLFGYLGKFKAKSPYDSVESPLETLNKSLESGSFTLVDRETMEKGKTYVRYFNSKIPIDKSSLVPIAGMNSAEWEQFKWFMRLDTAMYLLKISTS